MICPTANLQTFHSHSPDFPDDEVIAERSEHGVFVQDLSTGDVHRLATVEDCLRLHPRRGEIDDFHLFVKHTKWSPDGSRLLFVFSNVIPYSTRYAELPYVHSIFVIESDGTGLRYLCEFSNHPLWHPNSRHILTNTPAEAGAPDALLLTDIAAGESTVAAACVPGTGHPSYSPDGKLIAIDRVDGRAGEAVIGIIDVADDSFTALVRPTVRDHSHHGTHLHPAWSPDGGQILYASDASGTAQLCVVSLFD